MNSAICSHLDPRPQPPQPTAAADPARPQSAPRPALKKPSDRFHAGNRKQISGLSAIAEVLRPVNNLGFGLWNVK